MLEYLCAPGYEMTDMPPAVCQISMRRYALGCGTPSSGPWTEPGLYRHQSGAKYGTRGPDVTLPTINSPSPIRTSICSSATWDALARRMTTGCPSVLRQKFRHPPGAFEANLLGRQAAGDPLFETLDAI